MATSSPARRDHPPVGSPMVGTMTRGFIRSGRRASARTARRERVDPSLQFALRVANRGLASITHLHETGSPVGKHPPLPQGRDFQAEHVGGLLFGNIFHSSPCRRLFLGRPLARRQWTIGPDGSRVKVGYELGFSALWRPAGAQKDDSPRLTVAGTVATTGQK